MNTIAIIDIGSNSVRLVLVTVDERGFFKILDEVKESVRLGLDTGPNGELAEHRMDRALEAFKVFRSLCDSVGASEIVAIATAAVRTAPNRDYFLERAKNEAGIDIKVISGTQEAFYDYFGVINSIEAESGLIVDIGGCSTEFIHFSERRIVNSISLPMGALSITDEFNLRNDLKPGGKEKIQDFFKKVLSDVKWLKSAKNIPLIGVGGTFRNLGKVNRRRKGYPLDVSHSYKFSGQEAMELFAFIEATDLKKRRLIKGLSKERADIILGATLLIEAIYKHCNLTEIIISGSGLREGVSYEHVLGGSENPLEDVLDYEVMSLLRRYNMSENHSLHIWKLSKSIFDQLSDVHKIKTDVYKAFKTASLLHDIGVSISFYNHHKHSEYIILNSQIKGLNHKDIVMAAFIAASHRKDEYDFANSKYSNLLTTEDMENINKLGLILRIAECLDQRLDGSIYGVELSVKESSVSLKMLTDLDFTGLEENNLRSIQPSFEKILGRTLIIE